MAGKKSQLTKISSVNDDTGTTAYWAAASTCLPERELDEQVCVQKAHRRE
jgi:hypothetical protein